MIHINILELVLLVIVVAFISCWCLVGYQLRYDNNQTGRKLDALNVKLDKLTRISEWHAGFTFDEELERRWTAAAAKDQLPFNVTEWHVPSREQLAGLLPEDN